MNSDQSKQGQRQRYLDGVLRAIEEAGGEGLSETEVVLGRKYLEVQKQVNQMHSQAMNTEKEISVRKAQLDGLRDDIKREYGRASGIMDALLTLWGGPTKGQQPSSPTGPDVREKKEGAEA